MENTVYGWSGTVQRRGGEGYGTDQSSLIAKMIQVPRIALLPRDQGSTQSSNPLNTPQSCQVIKITKELLENTDSAALLPKGSNSENLG